MYQPPTLAQDEAVVPTRRSAGVLPPMEPPVGGGIARTCGLIPHVSRHRRRERNMKFSRQPVVVSARSTRAFTRAARYEIATSTSKRDLIRGCRLGQGLITKMRTHCTAAPGLLHLYQLNGRSVSRTRGRDQSTRHVLEHLCRHRLGTLTRNLHRASGEPWTPPRSHGKASIPDYVNRTSK